MLIPRQVGILLYLIDREDWCGGEELCARFGMTKNTLLQELRHIRGGLGEGLTIESGRRGYRITRLTGRAREEVRSQLASFGAYPSVDVRPASILLYVLHRRRPVTIRELAQEFYLSKSAVDRELKTVRRWLEDFRGLEPDISGNQGLRVLGSEKSKRLCCARYGSRRAFLAAPLEPGVRERYARAFERAEAVAGDVLREYGLLLPGGDFRLLVRFLSAGIVRSGLGFLREEESRAGPVPAAADRMADRLGEDLGCTLTETERRDLWEIIAQSGPVTVPGIAAGLLPESGDGARLEAMEARARQLLALPAEEVPSPGREELLRYMAALRRRERLGSLPVGGAEADTVTEHPLLVHLLERLLPEFFGEGFRTAAGDLALLLAGQHRADRPRLRVLLVSNQSWGVVRQIEQALGALRAPEAEAPEVVPGYAYGRDPSAFRDFDVKLTTEPEVRLMEPDFHYVPAVLSREELLRLETHCRRREEELRRERLARTAAEMPLREEVRTERVPALADLVGEPGRAAQTCHRVRERTLFVCRTGPDCPLEAVRYTLKKPLVYRWQNISKLLFISCPEGDGRMVERFEYVSELLKQP